MKFRIVRASDYLHCESPPCPGAVMVTEKEGKHGRREWEIEVADLNALLKLWADVGDDLIVSGGERPAIWIYDDYME